MATNVNNAFFQAATVVALAASSCCAVVNTRIDWQVSIDNVTWATTLRAYPGNRVFVRALVSYIGTDQPIGLASLYFQPTIDTGIVYGTTPLLLDVIAPFVNGGAGGNTSTPIGVVTDTSDPAQLGRLFPWGRVGLPAANALSSHLAPTGGAIDYRGNYWLRIAQAQVTSWCGGQGNTTGNSGVPISQPRSPAGCAACPPFDSQLENICVFKYAVDLNPAGQGPRRLTIGIAPSCMGNLNPDTFDREVYWFAASDLYSGSIRGTAVINSATIALDNCGSADFNGDGDAGTDADIEAFFACLGGDCCQTCGSADFNGDGDAATDADIEAFFRILAGGPC